MQDTILLGDAVAQLRQVPSGSVQTCVTSPPYFGLRDYRVEGQIGLEDTPEAYTECLLQVFREVHRVLRDDGTLWLNIGDSYHGGGYSNHRINGQEWLKTYGGDRRRSRQADRIRANPDLKPKDLIGIPWRIAFALQAEGWWLRADIIWAKGSCLPESVTDRPTRVHEYVFLLTKAQSYYYDQEAIREPLAICNAQRTTETYDTAERYGADNGGNDGLDALAARIRSGEHLTRNKRSVWNINPKPFAGAHFAVMPTELAETCVKAGSKPGDLVLDPFAGSGTTLVVAKSLDRCYVGIELNPEYVEIARQRLIPVHEEADQRAFAREVEGVFIPGAQ
jgi:DNA modification methylase